jgi:hypothetical protein
MVEIYWRIMFQTPACFQKKQAGVCSTSGYVLKKAGEMFLHCIFADFTGK